MSMDNVVPLPVKFKPHAIETPRRPLPDIARMAALYGDNQRASPGNRRLLALDDEHTREIIAQVIGLAEQAHALAVKVKKAPYHKIALSIGLDDAASDIETLAALYTPLPENHE